MWEYKVLAFRDTGFLEEGLNKHAKDGWEVVSVNVISEPGAMQVIIEAAVSSGFVVTYKRKKSK